ncbi:cupin [Paracoccus acridae]|uniref:Cupin n=1 Tax=Paracoccus acridae TaxID=1795310 RepID=A0ABQ1VLV0_9RHOB|nr:cupin domain-containing protein [Paracoccus acridae]GGF74533.1 cupin [Paracoccus acridae]
MTASRTYDAMGILFRFHAFPAETMDKFCLVEAVVPPGLGAPPNHHAGETEAFYVLEGEIAFTLSGETQRVQAGAFVSVPDGAVHSFQAVGLEPARLLIINAPGHMHEAFFTRTGSPVADTTAAPKPLAGPPDVARILAVAADVGMVIVPPGDTVQ